MSKPKPLPEASTLWELFDLNPLTGKLIWKSSPSNHIPAGSIAGGAGPYAQITVHGKAYQLHRIIYKWATGEEPGAVVEHKFDDPLDNRPWMLIDSTYRKNSDTKEKLAGKPTRGVNIQCGKYQARIFIEGHLYCLGTFDAEEEAGEAYAAALQNFTEDSSWRPPPRITSSQYRGVSLIKGSDPPKWKAELTINGKRTYLGCFSDERTAAAAVEAAKKNTQLLTK